MTKRRWVTSGRSEEEPQPGPPLQPASQKHEPLVVQFRTSGEIGGSQAGLPDLGVGIHAQPRLCSYPKTKFGAKERSFSNKWYVECP